MKELIIIMIMSALWICSAMAGTDRAPIHSAALSSTLSYDDFISLSPVEQDKLVHAVQDILVVMDKAGASSDEDASAVWYENAVKWTADQVLCVALASDNDDADFCINLGVVKSVNPGETVDVDKCVPGPTMHDFDTSKVLTQAPFDLGETAKDCPAHEMPCSPFFGFSSNGDLLCTKSKRTAVCQSLAKKAPITIAQELSACAASGAVKTSKTNCDGLKNFYNSQLKVVSDRCGDSYPPFACGLFKEQITADQTMINNCKDVNKINAYLESAQAGPQTGGAPTCPHPPVTAPFPKRAAAPSKAPLKIVSHKPVMKTHAPAPVIEVKSTATTSEIATAQNANPDAQSAPPASAPSVPTQIAADVAANQDANATISSQQMPASFNPHNCESLKSAPSYNLVFDDFVKEMFQNYSGHCVSVSLANGSVLTVDRSLNQTTDATLGKTGKFLTGAMIQPPSVNGVKSVPILLSPEAIYGVAAASRMLISPSFKNIDTVNLIAYYLPMAQLPSVNLSELGQRYPSQRYKTANGTIITFSSKTKSIGEDPYVVGQITNAPGFGRDQGKLLGDLPDDYPISTPF
jgi:hypothetical protein